MTVRIPASIKTEFNKGFDSYIKAMGKDLVLHLKPFQVTCPNCISNPVQNTSSNVYNTSFIKPVNIFVETGFSETIFPIPFNISVAPSGIQYNPTIPNPKPLKSSICPVCKGRGVLQKENKTCIKAVVTHGINALGAASTDFIEVSAGKEDLVVTRVKTFACNYKICETADLLELTGIKYKKESPVRLKGLGGNHITEFYISEINVGGTIESSFDNEPAIKIEQLGQSSNQAPDSTPSIPPEVPGDDVW